MTEETYTLAEADRELRLRECATRGHDWQLVTRVAEDIPTSVFCERCGKSYPVIDPDSEDGREPE